VVDFGTLPPEVNSARMYSGPGAEPMMIAATAWDELAAELGTAAGGYNSVISELTGAAWAGPASASMVSAVVPYVTWLSAIAGHAEQTAIQARAAAAAFETAFAMTVPPPVIAANRVLLATLVATNFFGQNTPAIAATEAQYAEMWAQDAAAMYGYAASSAAAAEVPRLTPPPNTTSPDAESAQFAAAAQAATTSAGHVAHVAATTAQFASAATVPQTLRQLSTSAATSTHYFIWNTVEDFLKYGLPTPANNWAGLTPANYTTVIKQTLQAYFGVGIGNFGWSMGQQLTFGPGGSTIGSGGAWYPTPQFSAIGLVPHGGGGVGAVAAGANQAGRIGALSVPPGWATPVAEVGPAATGVEGMTGLEAAPAHTVAATAPTNAVLGGVPAGSPGRRSVDFSTRYGARHSVIVRPPSAG